MNANLGKGRLQQVFSSFYRFPLVLLSAAFGSFFGILGGIAAYGDPFKQVYTNLAFMGFLGVPLYFGLAMTAMKYGLRTLWVGIGAAAIASLLAVDYYGVLPQENATLLASNVYSPHYTLVLAALMLVVWAPYAKDNNTLSFWRYSETITLRGLIALIQGSILCGGALGALYAFQSLLGVKISDDVYLIVSSLVMGFITQWIFLYMIPDDFAEIEKDRLPVKWLQTLAQYVLLPLACIYTAVIYIYLISLTAQGWQHGEVARSVFWSFIFGVSFHLIIYPRSLEPEGGWIKKVLRIYYYTTYPLLLVLFISFFLRIRPYGFTVDRYLGVMISVGLALTVARLTVNRNAIRFLPISWAVLLILSAVGPWGMSAVSQRSQLQQMVALLERERLLSPNGNLMNKLQGVAVSDSTLDEAGSIVRYLREEHDRGLEILRPLLRTNPDSLMEAPPPGERSMVALTSASENAYLKAMGLEKQTGHPSITNYVVYSTASSPVVSTAGYDYLVDVQRSEYKYDNLASFFTVGEVSCWLDYTNESKKRVVFAEGQQDSVAFALDSLVNSLRSTLGSKSQSGIDPQRMIFQRKTPHFKLRLELTSIGLETHRDSITFFKGHLLINP